VPQIEIYLTPFCPYCVRARRLLDGKDVAYQVIDLTADPSRWEEMTRRSGRHTVPQVFIDEHHVGGYDDLAELDRSGGLDPLLGR
jgi:glutaredoxin 3